MMIPQSVASCQNKFPKTLQYLLISSLRKNSISVTTTVCNRSQLVGLLSSPIRRKPHTEQRKTRHTTIVVSKARNDNCLFVGYNQSILPQDSNTRHTTSSVTMCTTRCVSTESFPAQEKHRPKSVLPSYHAAMS